MIFREGWLMRWDQDAKQRSSGMQGSGKPMNR